VIPLAPLRVRCRGALAAALCFLAPLTAAGREGQGGGSAFGPDRERAFALLESGEVEGAADAFAALLERDPRDPASIEGRVRALLRLQQWLAALDESREHAADLDSTRVLAVYGEALFRAGRLDEIEAVLGELVRREDASGRALATLGRLRAAEGREAEAVELMARAVEAAPADRDVLFWASGSTATRPEAVRRLERYLELSGGDDPDRIEAARSGIEVLRALGERAVWVPEAWPERAEIPLTRIWDPGTGTTQGLVIGVGLGERKKPVPLLLDTGSPGLFVIRRAARKRGLVPLAEQSQFGGGGDERHRSTRGLFTTASIDGLRYREALASSNKQEMDPTGRYHGVIGLAVFEGYRITLDLRDDRLWLEPPAEAAEGDPYWTVEGQWLVKGSMGGAPGLWLLDTGATFTMLDRAKAERVPGARLGPDVSVRGFGGRIGGARRVDGIEVTFQGLTSRRKPMTAIDLSTRSRLGGVELWGFIGLDLLDGKRIVIDTVSRRIAVH
jgi:tetratricopeptide (TPR) repeat protein